ncbi:hypothetical protein ACFW5T_31665, partial [Streptomyces sp. NPDC058766]
GVVYAHGGTAVPAARLPAPRPGVVYAHGGTAVPAARLPAPRPGVVYAHGGTAVPPAREPARTPHSRPVDAGGTTPDPLGTPRPRDRGHAVVPFVGPGPRTPA